jgi:hypothetical protein
MIPSYTVFLYPELDTPEPSKFEEIVDLIKMPNGVVRMMDRHGIRHERRGEVIRVRMDDLPDRPEE